MRWLQQVVVVAVGTALVGCDSPELVAAAPVEVKIAPVPLVETTTQPTQTASVASATARAPQAPPVAPCSELSEVVVAKDPQRVAVFVRADGSVCFGDQPQEVGAGLTRAVRAAVAGGVRKATIYADAGVVYGRVIAVMDSLKQGGISRIAFGVSKQK